MRIFCTILLTLFALSSQAQLPLYADVSAAAGVQGEGINYCLAAIDFDQDGWEDLYVGSKNSPNSLYRNNGDGTFTNVAASVGLDYAGNTYAAMWLDFDNDGDPDLYVGNWNEPNLLYLNTPSGFIEVGEQLGVADAGRCRSLCSADVNGDGWLDIYVVNINQHNAFYLSDDAGGYIDHYYTSFAVDNLTGMGSIFFDSDNDGDVDLYLLHDAYQPNRLYINDGTGVFSNQSFPLGAAHSGEGMGVDIADINHDGWMDVYITNNFDGNALLLNDGDGSFTNVEEELDVADPGMGWGVAFIDYNLDGEKDLYMVNNYAFSTFINTMYQNLGDMTFEQVGQGTVLDSTYPGAGMAVFDFDKDGKEDIAVANGLNVNSPGVQLFHNQGETGNYIAVRTEGTVSNREGIGSRLTLYSEGGVFTDEHVGMSGYSQQNSPYLYFGLGERSSVDSLTIQWSSGIIDTFYDLEINQRIVLVEGSTLEPGDADLNDDLVGDVTDLLDFLASFGCEGDCGDADQTGNGTVDTVDLLLLLTQIFSP